MSKLIIIDDCYENFSEYKNNFTKNEIIVFWNGYQEFDNKKWISILNFIEKNPDLVKNIYLKWIDDISNIKYDKVPIFEKLKIRNQYSAWWQSYFIEKSNYEHSPQIIDAIKLIAFQEWLKYKSTNEIEVFTDKF